MAVTPSYVILADDSSNTGKKIDNVTVTNESAVSVLRQMVTVGDAITAANRQIVTSAGGAGVTPVPNATSQLSQTVVNNATIGNIVVAAGSSGKTVRLYRLILFFGGSVNLTIKDATTALSGPMPFSQGGSLVLDFQSEPWWSSSSGNALNLAADSAAQISGTAYYVQS